jgi:hypothetical protein
MTTLLINDTNSKQKVHCDKEVQTVEWKREKSTQTKSKPRRPQYNGDKFNQFIRDSSKIILDELDNDSLSQAFCVLNGYHDDQHAIKNAKALKLNRLFAFSPGHNRVLGVEREQQLSLTQFDWNATGSLLIIVYGNKDRFGVVSSYGLVEIWKMDTRKKSDSKVPPEKPISSLVYESAFNCVAAHPHEPNKMFACGAMNGEIVIFQHDNDTLTISAVSQVGEYYHEGAITSLAWHYNANDEWILYSTGFDNKLLLWTISNKLNHPVGGYFLYDTQEEKSIECFVGNTLILFKSHQDECTIAIGCDCGHILTSQSSSRIHEQNISAKLTMKWSSTAKSMLLRISPSNQQKVIHRAEEFVRINKKDGVDRSIIYAIGIPPHIMYPALNPNVSHPHLGTIHSLDYCNGQLLSSGDDGVVVIHDIGLNGELEAVSKIQNTFQPKKTMSLFCTQDVSNMIHASHHKLYVT